MPSRIRRLCRAYRSDRRGGILPLVGLTLTVLVAVLAFAVDYGSLFVAKRRAQGNADLAALVAAQSPGDAERLARLSLADNNSPDIRSLAVETGLYSGDASLAAANRFVVGGSPANAVRVTLGTASQLVFGRFLTGRDEFPIATKALAKKADLAGFTIGSRLARLQGGVPNAILGAMLGTQISLSAMDYDALVGARLDAFRVLDALAISLNLQAATYSQVLQGQASIGQVAAAAATAAGPSGASFAATSAFRQLASGLAGNTTRIPLATLVSVGDLGGTQVGGSDPSRPLSVGAMDLVTAAAAIANGQRQVQVDLGTSLPGIANVRLTIGIGERPQSSALGPIGISASTAQTRLLLEARIDAPLGIGQIYLPVYVEAASATGTLTALSCPWSSPDQLSATISTQPGLLDAAIANVAQGAIATGAPKPDLTRPANLVSLPLLGVTGLARVTIASPRQTDLVFGSDDIQTGRVRTVATGGIATSLVSSLVGGATIQVNTVGLGIGLPASTIRSTVLASLMGAAPTLDATLDSALSILGIGLGEADVWVNTVRCDRAVLVQ